MGWLFTYGTTRKGLIAERAANWERTAEDGMVAKSVCLAHCYRGGIYSGVLWTVWERTFTKEGQQVRPTERWITCDLLRYQQNYGWGYKDMEESMHPFYYSCPLGYLEMVPIDQFGGHAEWREGVKNYHAQQAEKRRQRCPA
jgi:hypothetical protein